ncbi:hypothetical protein COY16_05135 [Candidatus Roizmanbacteria bacterium CG_4_10_14_0_2_um_filter_39_13]|uniref:MIP18 family-like domain-containing protein n=1 Tax=Candidatus Roizmanbacteria bacterium CG_4_10_14_0_2_um_filter_39_13 TaxID=1974825 RepID=A0A2M7TWH3_9BACT|nr:MAG: hypothetical protein COY16_05135 [Candidatus Roizmanbacteria bacterium CG_4_10_14_0_2_um_filter_39_13]
MPTKKQVENKLYDVMDPELDMSIMDLGLVYNVSIKKDTVIIQMTLTSLGCPLFETIESDIQRAMASLKVNEKNVKIDLTFDPPWSMDLMSEKAKATLGI